MKQENLVHILETLELFSPKKAKKIRILMQLEEMENGIDQKAEYHQRLWDALYQLFLSCLTKESKKTLIYSSVGINEISHYIEQKAPDCWVVSSTGAQRIEQEGETYQIVGNIPRAYGKGFVLEERFPETIEDLVCQKKEMEFYEMFRQHLAVLGGEMDFKETYLSDGYQIKDKRIPKEFVELLITTLGLTRIPKAKQENHTK